MDPLTKYTIPIIVLPLILLTIQQMVKQKKSLWDRELTQQDRGTLMRIAMFLLLPIVVLFHEFGHAAAILYFGGKIAEFHYGFLWGEVVPDGTFTEQQILIIYLAGNIVEVLLGLLALGVAFIVDSPPVVAMCCYVGLWSIGTALIIYPLMSFIRVYGDWQAIYRSPVHDAVLGIGICHALFVLIILWGIYGKEPRTWYVSRTRPDWWEEHKRREELVNKDASAANLLQLAWSYYVGGLDGQARSCLEQAFKLDESLPDAIYLKGWLARGKGDFKTAQESFSSAAKSDRSSPILKARAYMSIAELEMDMAAKQGGTGAPLRLSVNDEGFRKAIRACELAREAAPELADAGVIKAILFNRAGLHAQAETEILSLSGLSWLDTKLQERAQEELKKAHELRSSRAT